MKNDNVIMSPYSKLNYSSFYIEGLKSLFGVRAKFSFTDFLPEESGQCFQFISYSKGKAVKFAVDFHDSRKCDLGALEWCDYYAKVNLHETTYDNIEQEKGRNFLDVQKYKIFSITPGFGIRIFNIFETCGLIIKLLYHNRINYHAVKNQVKDVLRAHVKRRPLRSYGFEKSTENYIFFIGSIWARSTDYINIQRAKFIKACKNSKHFKFEGGFVDVGYEREYIDNIENLMYKERKIPLDDFIAKTKKSAVVFNNPSVDYCHGWKLAEYCSMGKAILSVPLSNELPFPLIHGTHIFYTADTEKDIEINLHKLMNDEKLRERLEEGSFKYWNEHVKPEAVIRYILAKSGQYIN